LVFVIGLFLFIKVFVIAPVIVKWHSMLPNYQPGEYIFVDKFYWKLKWWIKRWDVVVIMPESSNVSFLKRVIWLPGETIQIHSWWVYLCKTYEDWTNYINNDIENIVYNDWKLICKKLKEVYIDDRTVNLKWYPEKITTEAKCGINKFVLWNNQYLVLGDDRMYSTDSRCCFRWFCAWTGDKYYVTEEEILGKVWRLKF
jgi:signal peptidase I